VGTRSKNPSRRVRHEVLYSNSITIYHTQFLIYEFLIAFTLCRDSRVTRQPSDDKGLLALLSLAALLCLHGRCASSSLVVAIANLFISCCKHYRCNGVAAAAAAA
jgi:hypothetical protein